MTDRSDQVGPAGVEEAAPAGAEEAALEEAIKQKQQLQREVAILVENIGHLSDRALPAFAELGEVQVQVGMACRKVAELVGNHIRSCKPRSYSSARTPVTAH